ncbi:hypothetical protein PGTUg99_024218 [Puccinia graminis f. sp. tritici]|uniref:Reverse transcriptase domain-containing protein n=1 Tax=Puccinia graminis f. sp. tritici TaxID=56615 RepID=A0A5B0Q0Z6_PUCGR|nr:hypothetical protein PGTUg99_024218 [Puccinia graminis f. sp. tritici]
MKIEIGMLLIQSLPFEHKFLSQTQDSRLSHGPAVSTCRPSASPHPRPGNTEWGSPLRVQWAPHPARPKRGPAGPDQTRAIHKRVRAKPGPSPNGLGWPVGHPAHLPSLVLVLCDEDKIKSILNECHDRVNAGHFSEERTIERPASWLRPSPQRTDALRGLRASRAPGSSRWDKVQHPWVTRPSIPTTIPQREFFRNDESRYELALFDWAKAYRQIPTLESQWPFLMVKDLNGGLYVDTRITFGGVAGCGSFGVPADAWKRIMEHKFDVVKIFRWVDDNLFIKNLGSACDMKSIMKSITSRSVSLGVATSEEKSTMFASEQKFIGFIWNGTEKTVRLTEKKLQERKGQILAFLVKGAMFKFNDAEVLAGRLNHVSFLLPQLRCYIRSVYRWMNQWKKRWVSATEHLSQLRDLTTNKSSSLLFLLTLRAQPLQFWVDTLNNYTHTRLCPVTTPIEIGVEASCPSKRNRVARDGSDTHRNPHATVDKSRSKATTESVLRSRKSKDHHSNLEWKEIQRLLIGLEMENSADGLSRGVVAPHTPANRVTFPIPVDLEVFMSHS